MIAKCKELLVKYREIIVYLIVGVLTTIVSWGVCFLFEMTILDSSISWQNDIINIIGWVAGVLFAYPTNRKWVFKSTNPRIFKEFIGFTGSRVFTLLVDVVTMRICVNLCNIDFKISKIFIASVLVTILNYVFSKIFIFGKKKNKKKAEDDENVCGEEQH